jgi:carbon-monoxide dehydrogenase large subunit
MAVGRVRYVGDPVAVVLAENRYVAEDARNLVEIDYTPLPVVTDPEAALAADAPLLYEAFGSNMAFRTQASGGDIEAAFAQADHTVRLRLVNQRLAPASMEPRACYFDFDPASDLLSAWLCGCWRGFWRENALPGRRDYRRRAGRQVWAACQVD